MTFTILKTSTWYSNSRKLDLQRRTRLGTLGYLPLEVRRHIWGLLIERATNWPCVARINNGNLFPYFVRRPVVYGDFADPRYSHKNSKVLEIEYNSYGWVSVFLFRNGSLTVEYEFDAVLFSTHILHFNCPYFLSKFIAQLSPFQRRHFFHLSINLYTRCGCCLLGYNSDNPAYKSADHWLRPFMLLPPGLRNIFVDIGDKNIKIPEGQYLLHRTSLGYGYRPVSKDEFLGLMEIFLCRGKRCVPNATFSLQQYHLDHVYQGALGNVESVFNQLDHYHDDNISLIARFVTEETEFPSPLRVGKACTWTEP